MAASTLFSRNSVSSCYKRLLHLSLNTTTMQAIPFQARSLASHSKTESSLFEKMIEGDERRYFMFGGNGGVGKTSCAATLAVKFANHGHPTIIVSTDPAHSLSRSFDQDLTGGALIKGVDSLLFGVELNVEKHTEGRLGGAILKRFIDDSKDLDSETKQLLEGRYSETMDKPPPGSAEAVAIWDIMREAGSPKFSIFTRMVFDTTPKVDKLELLSRLFCPDFIASSPLVEIMKADKRHQWLWEALEHMKGDLFSDSTEFIIVTIPTVMAVEESAQLHASLKSINMPVRKLILNPILPKPPSSTKEKALDMIKNDPELGNLDLIEAPVAFVDKEMRGIQDLKFMGDMVWK